jgi:lipocalin-like protein
MSEQLRDMLIGAWKLVSYVEHPTDGSAPFHPLGSTPKGSSCTPPMATCRRNFRSRTDPSSHPVTGFHVDEDKSALTHSMFVSLGPNWAGQTQPRTVEIDGDTLHLGSVSPIQSSGKTVMSKLTWRRAERQ